MNNLGLVLIAAIVGGVCGGLGVALLSKDDQPKARAERGYDDRALRSEIAALREEMRRSLRERVTAPPTERGDAAPTVDSEVEIERPETPAEVEATARKKFVPSAFVESLRGKTFTVRDSDALVTLLSMQKDKIDPMLKELQKAIEADPSNPELYNALAAVHVSKLAAGVAVGPAAGPVYMQAIAAYDKALELNPDHWDARFNKSFTTSMAPEFVGLRPMSIRMFEDLVQRQESLPKQDDFRRTYMRLGTLYKDAGNTEKAKEIWKKGLERFPEDKQIQAALAVLGK
ncbi:MAG: tetratricopeptide repeat protein [Planctomycetota bacterium]|jgi:tetratricopeptide (TPR) repeat protein